ncbi:MAG: hypothetical protein HDR52_03410 [Treponema sp.]|nr:hypothetical protein [Treponema sp.]
MYLEIPSASEKQVLDLGPELVDKAQLFVFDGGEWILHDKTGKTVPNARKKIQGLRCALEIPEWQNEVLLQIKNSDTTALDFRLFSQNEYFSQTMKFDFLHGMSAAIFLFSICAQIFIWIFRKPKSSPFILAVTVLFFVYQLCMKGIVSALFWRQFSEVKFFLHLTYIVATFGFVIILMLTFKCINSETQFSIRKQINSALIGCAILFAIMFSFSPNFDFVYRLSICVLIAGLTFEITIIVLGAKSQNTDLSILVPWCAFYAFLIFRQIFHLVRKSKEYFLLSAIMENDYYFSYDVAFLTVNLGYVFIIARKIVKCDGVPSAKNEEKHEKKTLPKKKQVACIKEILSDFGLSRREIEVAEMLYSKQSSTKEIASQLNISENTVGTHIKHIFKKCGVNSRISFYKMANEKITRIDDASTPSSIAQKSTSNHVHW